MRKLRQSHLTAVPTHAPLVSYGVIGHETSNGKDYYVACGVFESALEALHFRGAARDLHNYAAWENYVAVAIYADGALYELRYTYSLEKCGEAEYKLQNRHPKLGYDFFGSLLQQAITH